jgi:hypothetical protein
MAFPFVGTLELLDVGRVDLLQRGVALIGQVASVGNLILADRTLKQTVDLQIRSQDRRRGQQQVHFDFFSLTRA